MALSPAVSDTRASSSDRAELPLAGLATVVFLGVTAGIQMSDRGLQSILSPAIKLGFGVGDAVMGALHGIAGILVASALAVPLARLADRHSRKTILLCLIAAWTALTALGALAPSFPLFFLGRAASGITEFAMIPIVYSLIPDLVGERWRVGSNLVFAALMATGASAGFYLGGNLLDLVTHLAASGALPTLEPWRLCMLLLSFAGIPLLLAGLATVNPPRQALTASTDTQSESVAAFARSQLRPILLFIGTAGGLAIAVQATMPMIAMATVRRYAADLGTVGHTLGLITLLANLGSLPLAGALDRGLRARFGESARPIVMGTASALSIPCIAVMPLVANEQTAMGLVAGFLLTTCIANALIPTMLQDLAPVSLRARCFAIYSFLIAIFCAAGPVLSGAISQFLMKDDLLMSIAIAGVPVLGIAVICSALSTRDSCRAG